MLSILIAGLWVVGLANIFGKKNAKPAAASGLTE